HPFDTISAINNGLDLEMPYADAYTPALVKAAIVSGQTSDAVVDDHVRRLMRTLFTVGFFDRPTSQPDDGLIDKSAHAAVAQRVEESAITLLKNNRALPLNAKKLKSIAVVGPDADKFVTGGGSGNVTPFSAVTALDGIKARAGSGVNVTTPAGRLPAPFPQKEEDLPPADDTNKYPGDASGDVHYDEGVLMGYRWYDAKKLTPAFPFGFGLSYTKFRYGPLSVKPARNGSKRATVSFSVTNAGS